MIGSLVGLVLAASSGAAPACWAGSIQEMIAAERAFSRQSRELGIREAFLGFLAEGAGIFDPGPAPARPTYEAVKPGLKGLLLWEPEFADLAVSCELGVSAGPWELRRDPADPGSARFGHFVSIWQKQPDSSWRVIVDAGGGVHAKPATPVARVELAPAPEEAAAPGSASSQREALAALEAAEDAFWAAAKERDIASALSSAAAEKLRFFPQADFPVVGKSDVLQRRELQSGSWEGVRAGAGVSLAGDFGYTYGASSLTRAGQGAGTQEVAAGGYLMVWRRVATGGWRVTLLTAKHEAKAR